jgi:DNA-binding transcriptional regulator YiaG
MHMVSWQWSGFHSLDFALKHEQDRTETMTRTDVVIKARKLLGLSQSRLAQCLGVSPKAVQSYEQGWRTIPNRFLSQLFTLLAVSRHRSAEMQPCWDMRSCDPAVQPTCPAWQSETGSFCWMLAADGCVMMNSDEQDPEAAFMTCPIFSGLLSR